MASIVIALGGNALGNNPNEQKELVKIPATKIAQLIKDGHNVIVGHGNGPQVGMIYNAFIEANKINKNSPIISFSEADGMSQGYIGYHLQSALINALAEINVNRQVMYVLTQTIVDENDPAFNNPTKPIGNFFKTLQEAKQVLGNDSVIKEDAGRGYRKVVASPRPKGFLGLEAIKEAYHNRFIMIVGGGGGIPTIKKDHHFLGVDGVIDKDLALSLMGQLLKVDKLIILTTVDYAYINYKKSNEKKLINVTVNELKKYIVEDQFAVGSMLPKIQACIEFVENNPKGEAIIASLDKLNEALLGTSGTHIRN